MKVCAGIVHGRDASWTTRASERRVVCPTHVRIIAEPSGTMRL
jgi:hypothetical protein